MKPIQEKNEKVSDFREKAKKVLRDLIKKEDSSLKQTTGTTQYDRDNTVGGK